MCFLKYKLVSLGKTALLSKGRMQITDCSLHMQCQCHVSTIMPSSILDYGTFLQRLSRKHSNNRLTPNEAVVIFLRESKLPTRRKIFKL